MPTTTKSTATLKRNNSTVRNSHSNRTSKSLVPLNTIKRRSIGSNSIKSPTTSQVNTKKL